VNYYHFYYLFYYGLDFGKTVRFWVFEKITSLVKKTYRVMEYTLR